MPRCPNSAPKLDDFTNAIPGPPNIDDIMLAAASRDDFVMESTTPRSHEEYQYLDLVRRIIQTGEHRADRTGTGTLALFAPPQMRFSLRDNVFPLLTTKRTFLRPIFEELMFFIRGQTDSKILSKKNVKIWDGNGSREALDKLGLTHRREGDLGPVYGFQWRHFGATYIDADADYTGQGVDQLRQVLDLIKTNPTDRRILLSAWNPADLGIMALPPCHMFCQFYVSTPTESEPTPKLSCQLYQRSCDMGLGVPFNIASYALLTIMIAYVTGLEPGEFIHCLGDAHVYKDHVDALMEQIERTPRPFPNLTIKEKDGVTLSDRRNRSVDDMLRDLEEIEFERLEITGYDPHAKVAMKMSV